MCGYSALFVLGCRVGSCFAGFCGWLFVTFNTSTDTFAATSIKGSSMYGFGLASARHVPSSAGGAFSFTVAGDADSFRITNPFNSYDSGDISYVSALSGGQRF